MTTRSQTARPSLIVVTGYTGAGKSTMANLIAAEIGATVTSFDWLMSTLRSHPQVWKVVEHPVEFQRRVGWDLLSRVAEEQLRAGRPCILDLVARQEARDEWAALAERYDASFGAVECICSNPDIHMSRVDGRQRDIPGWYELQPEWVERSRQLYEPLSGPKILIDATDPAEHNLELVMRHLNTRRDMLRSPDSTLDPGVTDRGSRRVNTTADAPGWF